jgi:hypothetical protein
MGGSKSSSRVISWPGTNAGAPRATRIAVAAACVGALGLAAGCANTHAVCAETQKTLEDFAAKTRVLPPENTVQWKQAIGGVADRLDVLARRADSGKLKGALRDTAASYRAAAAGVDHGDTSALVTVIHDQPVRLDDACR